MWALVCCAFFIFNVSSKQILANNIIWKINSAQNLWKAAPNRFTDLDHETKRIYLGTTVGHRKFIQKNILTEDHMQKKNQKLPIHFDARVKWSNCPSIGAIKDQGACSSDWAVAASTVASDRLCIASKSKIKVNISTEDLVSCDNWCSGCYGCDYEFPWIYLMRFGVVTGGDYGSKEGCKPSSFKPCGKNCNYTEMVTPECTSVCSNKNYPRSYNEDKYFGLSMYEFSPKNIKSIQKEILSHGPVTALLKVYEDFFSYKEGIYAYVHGDFLGYLSVKILGWGVENDIKYWLVANSWGKEFGQDGYFMIRRGVNECYIEGRVIGSHLKVDFNYLQDLGATFKRVFSIIKYT